MQENRQSESKTHKNSIIAFNSFSSNPKNKLWRDQSKLVPSMMRVLILWIVFTLSLRVAQSHYIKKVSRSDVELQGYSNQEKSLPIPFKKCFKVETEIEADQKYIEFTPSSLSLNEKRKSSLESITSEGMSLVEQLRSPMTYRHKAMVILEDFIILLAAPNKIVVCRESQSDPSGFEIVDSYRIEQFRSISTPFKMYKYTANRAIMIIQNQRAFYLLDDKGYQYYSLPLDITLSHLQPIGDNEIIIAEYNKGLGHYSIDQKTKTVQLIHRYRAEDLGMLQLRQDHTYIVDVNVNHLQGPDSTKGALYFLDAKIGLMAMDYDPESSKRKFSNPRVAVRQPNCEAFDSVDENYFVLLCQLQGYSSIVEVYRQPKEPQSENSISEFEYERLEPTYHNTYFTDVEVSDMFYMAFSNKLINVFWNTRKNKLPLMIESHSQISIPGIETFKLKKRLGETFLYTVELGQLVMYSMRESEATVKFRSLSPENELHKNITLLMYGSCDEIGEQEAAKAGNDILTCQIRQSVQLSLEVDDYDGSDDYSISASIIIILIIIFLVIIWICLKKYKGLEDEARKVLQNYKDKRGKQRRAI